MVADDGRVGKVVGSRNVRLIKPAPPRLEQEFKDGQEGALDLFGIRKPEVK